MRREDNTFYNLAAITINMLPKICETMWESLLALVSSKFYITDIVVSELYFLILFMPETKHPLPGKNLHINVRSFAINSAASKNNWKPLKFKELS